jgi:hypothetical protein
VIENSGLRNARLGFNNPRFTSLRSEDLLIFANAILVWALSSASGTVLFASIIVMDVLLLFANRRQRARHT